VTGWLGSELVYRLHVGVDPGADLNAPNSLASEPATPYHVETQATKAHSGGAVEQPAKDKEKRLEKAGTPGRGPAGVIPNLQARVVVGIFEQIERAEATGKELHRLGYSDKDISIVMQPAGSAPETPTSQTKAEQGTATGATTGAVIGGIAGLAALAIPGIGPVLAAGPIAVALGALTGGALGGLVGSFTGLGIPTEQAKAYEAAVRAGGVVMTVRAADRDAADRITGVMNNRGVKQAASYTEEL
jgi:hypothetical protein